MSRFKNGWARWLKGYHRRAQATRLTRHPDLLRQHKGLMRRASTTFLWLYALLWLLIVASCVAPVPAMAAVAATRADAIPQSAQAHRLALRREAQYAWGLAAPVATFAAQIHQESRWRTAATSPVGAQGLAQFMPATATWIGGLYPGLAERAPHNPTWAIRALVLYDQWLWQRISADTDCQRMAFTLAGYNGGLGWVYKRQKRSATPGQCLGATCAINPGVTPASQAENQHYPEVILRRYAPLYAAWGPESCP